VPTPPTWTVNPGDTLWKIAERSLGDPERYVEIVALNRSLSATPQTLQTGTVLLLPVDARPQPSPAPAPTPAAPLSGGPRRAPVRAEELDRFPPPRPGQTRTFRHAPTEAPEFAWTVDDGYSARRVRAYVQFAVRTGTALTFCPNGAFAYAWTAQLDSVRRLIAIGQVQIASHAFSHKNLTELSDDGVRQEIAQNEEWIQNSFGVTARPWLRPPYGAHDERTDAIAADLGYTHILLWDGAFDDPRPTPEARIAELARHSIRAGAVILSHADAPSADATFDVLLDIAAQWGVRPVTIDEMFGTSRATG
jgi:peptidoglycan-N-acetylglucosamine deacetylase